MNWIHRAEARFGHLAIPHLLHGIAFLSAAVFVFYKLNPNVFAYLVLDPELVKAGQVWRLVTYIFIPTIFSWLFPFPDWVNAAFYVMFMIWMGNGLEQAWGPFRLNLYCLITMLGITVAAFFFGMVFSHYILVQAFFFAFARFFPEEWITIMFVLPVKVKWLAWIDAAWMIYQFTFYGNSFRMGLLAAMVAYFLFFGREIYREARHRQEVTGRRRRFEEAVQTTDGEAMHQCAVCGRTEIVAPDLEFRVSKDGQEYCIEHLPKPAPSSPATS